VSVQKFNETFGLSSLAIIALACGVEAAVHVTGYDERRDNLRHGVEETDDLVEQVISRPVVIRVSIDI